MGFIAEWVESWLARPKSLLEEVCTGVALGTAVYTVYYGIAARKILEPKRRAWIMTCLAALVSTVVGAIVAKDILENYSSEPWTYLTWNPDVWVTESQLTKFCCINFISFLVADVVCGVIQYPNQFHFLTGWVHHAAYCAFLVRLYLQNLTSVFTPFIVEELPTLILGLGTIYPEMRTDSGFGLTFLVTRVLWHALGTYNACTGPPGHPIRKQAWFGVLSLALHLHWFYTWCSKYLFKTKKPKQGDKPKAS